MYIDKNYYKNEFGGKYDEDDLSRLIERAGILVDVLTHGRVRARGLEGLTKFQAGSVRQAMCFMVEHFVNTDGAPSADVESYSMSDMRVWNRKRNLRPWEAYGCGMWAWQMLMGTGLMRNA